MSEEKTYTYRYSARDVEEAKAIRREFVSGEGTEIERLRTIRKRADRRAAIPAITLGVIAALIFGTGFCFTMLWPSLFVPGIVIGILGLIGLALIYPLYSSRLKKERALAEEEVRQLSDAVIGRQA